MSLMIVQQVSQPGSCEGAYSRPGRWHPAYINQYGRSSLPDKRCEPVSLIKVNAGDLTNYLNLSIINIYSSTFYDHNCYFKQPS